MPLSRIEGGAHKRSECAGDARDRREDLGENHSPRCSNQNHKNHSSNPRDAPVRESKGGAHHSAASVQKHVPGLERAGQSHALLQFNQHPSQRFIIRSNIIAIIVQPPLDTQLRRRLCIPPKQAAIGDTIRDGNIGKTPPIENETIARVQSRGVRAAFQDAVKNTTE